MTNDELLEVVSAAFDGEATRPDVIESETGMFLTSATELRDLAELERALPTPDLSGEIARSLPPRSSPSTTVEQPKWARPGWRVLAPAFAAAAIFGAVLAGFPATGRDTAHADLKSEVLAAQANVDRFDARLTITEYGWHPRVSRRSFEGWFSYRSPETLSLTLLDQTQYPPGNSWVTNDVSFGSDSGESWSDGRLGCPVDHRPACLTEQRVIQHTVDRAPFDERSRALDLVVPVGGLVSLSDHDSGGLLDGTVVTRAGDEVVVTGTTSRFSRVLDSLLQVGDWRSFSPDDQAELRLDATTLVLRGVRVMASESESRMSWAAATGYDDAPGSLLLDVRFDVVEQVPDGAHASRPLQITASAGFVETVVDQLMPAALSSEMEPYRQGTIASDDDVGPEPATIMSWTDGRAWVTVTSTSSWDQARLFGRFGPFVSPEQTSVGPVFVDPGGERVGLHSDEGDFEIAGSVGPETLLEIAESIGVIAIDLPAGWLQAQTAEPLPSGVLRPDGFTASRVDGDVVTIVVNGPGRSGYRLVQRPQLVLAPPRSPSVVAVAVRDRAGRYDVVRKELEWIEVHDEEPFVVRMIGEGLSFEQLLAIAETLDR